VTTIHTGGRDSRAYPHGVSGPPADGIDAHLAEQIGLDRWAVLARLAHLMTPDGTIPGAWSVQMPTPDLIKAVAAGTKGWGTRIPAALDDLVTLGLLERVDSTPLGRGRGRLPHTWYAAWDPRFATPTTHRAATRHAPEPTPPTPGTPLTHPRFSSVKDSPLKNSSVKNERVERLTRPETSGVKGPIHEGIPDPAAFTPENPTALMNVMNENFIHEKTENSTHVNPTDTTSSGGASPAASRMVAELLTAIDWAGPPPGGVPDGILVAVIQDLQRRKQQRQVAKPGAYLRTTYDTGGPDAVLDYARNRGLLRHALGEPTSITPTVELMPAHEFIAARDADPAWYEQVRVAAAEAAPPGTVLTTVHLQAAALNIPPATAATREGRAAR